MELSCVLSQQTPQRVETQIGLPPPISVESKPGVKYRKALIEDLGHRY